MQTESYLGLTIDFADGRDSHDHYLDKKMEIESVFFHLANEVKRHPINELRAHLVRLNSKEMFTFAAYGNEIYLGIFSDKKVRMRCNLYEIADLRMDNNSILADRVSTFIMDIENDNYRYKSLESAWHDALKEYHKESAKTETLEREEELEYGQ